MTINGNERMSFEEVSLELGLTEKKLVSLCKKFNVEYVELGKKMITGDNLELLIQKNTRYKNLLKEKKSKQMKETMSKKKKTTTTK